MSAPPRFSIDVLKDALKKNKRSRGGRVASDGAAAATTSTSRKRKKRASKTAGASSSSAEASTSSSSVDSDGGGGGAAAAAAAAEQQQQRQNDAKRRREISHAIRVGNTPRHRVAYDDDDDDDDDTVAAEAAATIAPPPSPQRVTTPPHDPHFYGDDNDDEHVARDLDAIEGRCRVVESPKRIDHETQRIVARELQERRDRAARLEAHEATVRASGAPDSDSDIEEQRQRSLRQQRRNTKLTLIVPDAMDAGPNVATIERTRRVDAEFYRKSLGDNVDDDEEEEVDDDVVGVVVDGDTAAASSSSSSSVPQHEPKPLWYPTPTSSTNAAEQYRVFEQQRSFEEEQNAQFAMNVQETMGDTASFPWLFTLAHRNSISAAAYSENADMVADVRVVLREEDEALLRQPMTHERPCVKGDDCAGRHITGCTPITLVEALPPAARAQWARTKTWPANGYMCVLCNRMESNYAHFATLPDCRTMPQNGILSETCSRIGPGQYDLRDVIFSDSQSYHGTYDPIVLHCSRYLTQERRNNIVYLKQTFYRTVSSKCSDFFESGPGSLKQQQELETRSPHGKPRGAPLHVPVSRVPASQTQSARLTH